jgi:hypothetical protein
LVANLENHAYIAHLYIHFVEKTPHGPRKMSRVVVVMGKAYRAECFLQASEHAFSIGVRSQRLLSTGRGEGLLRYLKQFIRKDQNGVR